MASMRRAPLLLTLLCLLFSLTTAAKYNSWGDIPDCAVYCIKYWTITAQGSSCRAEDPKCYCMNSAWYFSMKNCIYDDGTAGCKISQSTKNKDGILSYVDDIFCPTLNGTSSTSTTSASTTSSGARLAAAATSDTDIPTSASRFTVKITIHSSSTSASSSSSSSVTPSSSSSSSSPSSPSSSASSSTTTTSSTDESSTDSSSTTTTSSTSSVSSSSSSSTVSSTPTPSSTSTSSYSVTTTIILVDPSGNIITSAPASAPTSTVNTGFVQDTSTLQSTAISSDAAAPGANVLFYDGAIESVLVVSSMMALVMLVGGMVLLVN